MKKKILIFDSHPVQYRVQIYQALAGIDMIDLKVVYSNNSSVVGRMDQEFGLKIAWDIPLEEGYAHRYVSTAEPDTRIADFFQWEHRGVDRIVREERPDVVFVNGLTTRFYLAAYFAALRGGIPIWMRTETQDQAFKRSRLKALTRSIVWTTAYFGLARCFYIGELNKKHLLAHGVPARKLVRANYATFDRFKSLPADEKAARRTAMRARLDIADDTTVVAFSGKLVPKKNPGLMIDALERRPDKDRFVLLFIGDGELRPELERKAEAAGVEARFPGFVNQMGLIDYYLASDILVLPSNQSGETWGLVVNEGLQAGCGAIISKGAGSYADFDGLERIRVVEIGDAGGLARAMGELSAYPRSFDWAEEVLKTYSIDATVNAIATEMEKLKT